MVPVPGRSTHSKAVFWQLKHRGWGGITIEPQLVHFEPVSRPSRAASQKGWVSSSACGSRRATG